MAIEKENQSSPSNAEQQVGFEVSFEEVSKDVDSYSCSYSQSSSDDET